MTARDRVRVLACAGLAALLLPLAAGAAAAQAGGGGATGTPADSAGAPRTGTLDRARYARAAWLSARVPLRAGDLVTVVVDEQTAARERVSRVADGDRTSDHQLTAGLPDETQDVRIRTGSKQRSRDVGEAGRSGGLVAVLTATVVSVEPGGAVRLRGTRRLLVDGREQSLTLEGLVRAEDLDVANRVRSDRIAEAVITYKGGKIGPRNGLVGRMLGLLWP